jgi:hypothetical protein
MKSILVCDILLVIYVLVDVLYQGHADDFRKVQPGKRSKLSDNEVMTMIIAMDYKPFPSERQ